METKETTETLALRKAEIVAFLRKHTKHLYWLVLLFIILVTFNMRMQPIKNLRDVTTNQYIPAEPDSFIVLYYAEYILENGQLPEKDTLRYYPNGFSNMKEFFLLPYFLVYLYKFLHFFNSDVTIQLVDLLYPPLTFAVSLLFFFLFASKLFNKRVALLAAAYLSVSTLYLYRTTAGFSDKESLALMFIYMSFYFFIISWKTERARWSVAASVLAGLATAGAGLVWGGVQFLFFSYGLFAIINLLLNKFQKKDALAYAIWFGVAFGVLHLIFPEKFSVGFLISNVAIVDSTIAFVACIIYLTLRKLAKPFVHSLEAKHRFGAVCVGLTLLFGLIVVMFTYGPSFVLVRFYEVVENLTSPFSATRWARTVAESRQPYLKDLINEVGGFYFLLFLAGLLALIYQCFKEVKEHKFKLFIVFSLFYLSLLYTRYSSESFFNGATFIARLVYFGMMVFVPIFFLILYVYSRRKKIDVYGELRHIDSSVFFMLCFTLITIIGARSAIRLFTMIAPTIAILIAFGFDFFYQKITHLHRQWIRYVYVALVLILLVVPNVLIFAVPKSSDLRNHFRHSLLENYNSGYQISKYSGSSYNQQWQVAMKWARENMPKGAVFAHWWDYGYYVIYGSRRATLSDGGNTGGGGLNYFIGRYVLTAQNATEALEYLKSKGATHVLMVSEEVGKYPAYSSIGSDLSFDRYSYINVFSLDASKTQETRNATLYVYLGGSPLDEDFVYNEELFPAGQAAIGAVLVPMAPVEGGMRIEQPEAIIIYNNKQVNVPAECVVSNKQIFRFPKKGLQGCFQIIPRITGDGKVDYIANALYVSRKVSNTLFANLYLFGQEWEGFKIAYSDEGQLPLAIYPQGNLYGPLKIWEVNPPASIQEKEIYKTNALPDPKLQY